MASRRRSSSTRCLSTTRASRCSPRGCPRRLCSGGRPRASRCAVSAVLALLWRGGTTVAGFGGTFKAARGARPPNLGTCQCSGFKAISHSFVLGNLLSGGYFTALYFTERHIKPAYFLPPACCRKAAQSSRKTYLCSRKTSARNDDPRRRARVGHRSRTAVGDEQRDHPGRVGRQRCQPVECGQAGARTAACDQTAALW